MLNSVWLNTGMLKTIGWTLIHSVWQTLILLLLLKIILLVIQRKASALRYQVSMCVLLLAVLCAVYTFQNEYKKHRTRSAQTTRMQPQEGFAMATGNKAETGNYITGNAPGRYNLPELLTAISPYLALGWMLGMLIYGIKIANSWLYLKKLRSLPSETVPGALEKLRSLCTKMDVSRPVRLIISDRISEPFTFGHFRPVILLPFSYAMQVPVKELEMILAHELAHICRNDFFANTIQSMLEAVYFFNPFFLAISRVVRDEREYCCDDMATACCGNKETMAIALTNLKLLSAYPPLSLAVSPVKSSFQSRIYRLINPDAASGLSFRRPFSTLILLFSFLIFLTKCVSELDNAKALPSPSDPLTQLYADNQANRKIEIFNYTKDQQLHELFMVSTEEGKPLYAYLDGDSLAQADLTSVHKVILQSRNISAEDLAKIPPAPREKRIERNRQLNQEIDSIDALIKLKKATGRGASIQAELDSLQNALSARTDEVTALAMENYQEDVRNIPSGVQLHELLTRIINTRQYTQEDRKKLNELLQSRN